MRIGLVIYGSLDQGSGGYLYDRLLVDSLRRHGHQVEVISLPPRPYLRNLGDNFSPGLRRRLLGLELDVLLQDELNHPSLLWLNDSLRGRGNFAIVSIVHHLKSMENNPWFSQALIERLERRYLASVDGFVFNSPLTQAVVSSYLPAPRPGVVATPGGDRLSPAITPAQVERRGRQAGPLQLIFLGNLIQRKAPHILLEAAASLADRVHIHFVGRQDMDTAYVEQLKRMAPPALASFHGYLDNAELRDLLGSCHLLVLPSFYEGFGIAYLEGMGFGLPAVGTTAGAAGTIIEHERNGFLIEPGQSAPLEQLLRALSQDREQLIRMGLQALATYKRFPSWEASMTRVEAFLSGYNQSFA